MFIKPNITSAEKRSPFSNIQLQHTCTCFTTKMKIQISVYCSSSKISKEKRSATTPSPKQWFDTYSNSLVAPGMQFTISDRHETDLTVLLRVQCHKSQNSTWNTTWHDSGRIVKKQISLLALPSAQTQVAVVGSSCTLKMGGCYIHFATVYTTQAPDSELRGWKTAVYI